MRAEVVKVNMSCLLVPSLGHRHCSYCKLTLFHSW